MKHFSVKDPNGRVAEFRFQVLLAPHDQGKFLLIVADIPENKGMSSTNCFEYLAVRLAGVTFPTLPESDLLWVQCDSSGDYFWVEFSPGYRNPRWRPLSDQDKFDLGLIKSGSTK